MDKDIDILRKENEKLSQQLQKAKAWMQCEVSEAQNSIKNKEALTEDVQEKIYKFFSPETLSHFPSDGIENIISSELIYDHLMRGDNIDGTWVMIWYQKVLDSMVELYITKWFRKYVSKHSWNLHPINDPLDKSLWLVCTKKHILSLWRVYQIISLIKEQKTLSPYTLEFHSYLKSRPFLEKALLETHFFLQLEQLVHLHVLTEKRHSWTLSRADTLIARNICIWDFTDSNALLSILGSSQDTDI